MTNILNKTHRIKKLASQLYGLAHLKKENLPFSIDSLVLDNINLDKIRLLKK